VASEETGEVGRLGVGETEFLEDGEEVVERAHGLELR
jgi:hypothetical protein